MIDVQPIAYSLRNDTLVTSLLLVSFIIIAMALSLTREYLSREAQSFLYTKDYSNFYHSSVEINFQLLLCLQTIAMCALSAFAIWGKGNVWSLAGIFTIYFFGKYILYYVVNSTFFDQKQVKNWDHIFSMLTVFEGLILFPVVVLQVYVGWSVKVTLICIAVIVFSTKLLSIYKSFNIFFAQTGGFLQIILYFCTLEVIPAFILYGMLIKNIG